MSNLKTNAEMLASIKQSNKEARETRAKKFGFKNATEFILHLEDEILNGKKNSPFIPPTVKGPSTKKEPTLKPKAKVTVSTSVPTIHVIDILDASGSMFGDKFAAALKGINIGIKQLKEDKAKVKYTYTLCDFSDDVIFKHIQDELCSIPTITGSTRGSTALYDAIGKSIGKISGHTKPGDKVLVNIYTDGQENSSREFNRNQISEFIKNFSAQGWTFTFIGTDADVQFVKTQLSFHASNTLVYDGTALGLEKSFVANNNARSAYSSKVSKGEDVSTGFYKDIK